MLIGYRERVERFDATMKRWRVPIVALILLLVVWVVKMSFLGMDGQLSELARQGLLYSHDLRRIGGCRYSPFDSRSSDRAHERDEVSRATMQLRQGSVR